MKLVESSFIIKFINFISTKVKKILKNSTIITFFTTINQFDIDKYLKNSLFYNITINVLNFVKRLLFILKLDKYLKNSIFINSIFWLCLIIIGIPILPTILLGILSIISIISLILKYCLDSNFKFKKVTLNYIIAAFIICIIFNSILSFYGLSSMSVLGLNIVLILNYYVVINSVNRVEEIKKIFNCFIIIGFFVSIYGIYQYFFHSGIYITDWMDSSMFSTIGTRVVSTFNNPNILGEYLIFLVMICFSFFITEENKNKKIFYAISTVLSILCLIFTFSRGCWIGILIALLLMLIIMDKRFILVYVIILLGASIIMPDSVINRLLSIGNLLDTSTAYRVNIWKGTFEMLGSFFLSGVGFGTKNFIHSYNFYAYKLVDAEHSHNLILHLLSGMGIIGIIVFGMLLLSYFKLVISNYVKYRNSKNKNMKFLNILLLSIISSMIGYLVQSMFDNTWYNYSIFLLFFVILGLGVAITFVLKKESMHEKKK